MRNTEMRNVKRKHSSFVKRQIKSEGLLIKRAEFLIKRAEGYVTQCPLEPDANEITQQAIILLR